MITFLRYYLFMMRCPIGAVILLRTKFSREFRGLKAPVSALSAY